MNILIMAKLIQADLDEDVHPCGLAICYLLLVSQMLGSRVCDEGLTLPTWRLSRPNKMMKLKCLAK